MDRAIGLAVGDRLWWTRIGALTTDVAELLDARTYWPITRERHIGEDLAES